MVNLFVAATTAYILGSIPFGYLAGRILKGIDIRKYGSGNVGATNVFRTVGKMAGIFVLLLDATKGFVSVSFLPAIFLKAGVAVGPNLFRIIIGIACVCGHNWTIFLRFKGGKGVATTIGVMLAIAPAAIGAGILVWLLVFILTRYVSLSSIISSLAIPAFTLLFKEPREFTILIAILSILIIYKHRSNIKRLLRGEEPKLAVFGTAKKTIDSLKNVTEEDRSKSFGGRSEH